MSPSASAAANAVLAWPHSPERSDSQPFPEPSTVAVSIAPNHRIAASHRTRASFISPDVPHSRDPRHDYDMVSYAVVKVIRDHFEDPASPYRWKPKLAFHALARRYGAAKRCDPAPAG